MMILIDLEAGASTLILANDSQTMISFQLCSHSKPLGPMIREIFGFLIL